MTIEQKIISAAIFGTMAFNAGKKATPCHDSNLMGLLKGNKVGEGIPVLDAWIKAWHDANLAQKV